MSSNLENKSQLSGNDWAILCVFFTQGDNQVRLANVLPKCNNHFQDTSRHLDNVGRLEHFSKQILNFLHPQFGRLSYREVLKKRIKMEVASQHCETVPNKTKDIYLSPWLKRKCDDALSKKPKCRQRWSWWCWISIQNVVSNGFFIMLVNVQSGKEFNSMSQPNSLP